MRELYEDILPALPLNEAVGLQALGEHIISGFKITTATSSRDDFSKNIYINGLEHLENIRTEGAILTSAHLFLFHNVIDKCLSHLQHMEYFAIGKASQRQVLEKHGLQSPEVHEQLMMLQRTQELYRARKVLKRGGMIAIIADGEKGLPAEPTPFLKRERPFANGMGQLAAFSGKPVLLIDCHLQPDGRFQGNIRPLRNMTEENSDPQVLVQCYTTEYVRWLEDVWQRHPESISLEKLNRYINSPIHK